MTKGQKIFVGIIALAVYLNVGWAIGSYWVSLEGTVPQSLFGQFLAGPADVLNEEVVSIEKSNHQMWIFMYSIFWILDFVVLIIIWIVYFILWLIFWGGIVKLLGFA